MCGALLHTLQALSGPSRALAHSGGLVEISPRNGLMCFSLDCKI